MRSFASFLKSIFLTGVLLALAACTDQQEAETGPVVLAAASLQEALEDVADAWMLEGHPRPALAFAGTPALARQIEHGAPADIAFLADEEWMDRLEQRRLLKPGTRSAIVGNRLVLIAPAAAQQTDPPIEMADIAARLGNGDPGGRLAMGDPDSVPAGRYARAALRSLGVWDAIRLQIAPTESVRAAMALVERGEAPLGIVYESDLESSNQVRLAGMISAAHQPSIRYPAALLKTASHRDAAGFLAFLKSATAQAIFADHRFSPVAQP